MISLRKSRKMKFRSNLIISRKMQTAARRTSGFLFTGSSLSHRIMNHPRRSMVYTWGKVGPKGVPGQKTTGGKDHPVLVDLTPAQIKDLSLGLPVVCNNALIHTHSKVVDGKLTKWLSAEDLQGNMIAQCCLYDLVNHLEIVKGDFIPNATHPTAKLALTTLQKAEKNNGKVI